MSPQPRPPCLEPELTRMPASFTPLDGWTLVSPSGIVVRSRP
ncbi:hypothetical protein [Streptomyces viridosporus]|nr:hypothetical protein [Streptomyces viridosporus]